MAITSIANDARTNELDSEIRSNPQGRAKTESTNASKIAPDPSTVGVQRPSGTTPVTDVAAVLLSEVATSDLTKLSTILEPAANSNNSEALDSLLRSAIQAVADGNTTRALGYLANYATRDPRRAEELPMLPALEPVRDKIDSMVSRMTVVAKMSAEDGLSRAEQVSSQAAGKLSNWDTRADVLLQMAHRLFDAGGYANYTRTAELAKLVSDASETKPVQALAASASAAGMQMNPLVNQMAGINVPYWVSPDMPVVRPTPAKARGQRHGSRGALDDIHSNIRALSDIGLGAIQELWHRAPLLVMMLVYLGIGLAGGLVFALASRIWPGSTVVAAGNFAFDLWGIGFLAMVGFGFYVRIRYSPPRRS